MMQALVFSVVFFMILVVLNSTVIIGAYIAANHKDSKGRGLILYSLNKFIESKLGYWSKPFFGCYKCMASVWTFVPILTLFLVAGFPTNFWVVLLYIPYVFSVSAVTSMMYAYYESLLRDDDPNLSCVKKCENGG